MSYHRPLSPGGRRIQNVGRVSDSLTDPYYASRHGGSFSSSPRTSTGGVIPISTQTFVNISPLVGTRLTEPPRNDRYETYSGRPRRSSLVDTNRGPPPPISQLPNRSRPAVIQNEFRPNSPLRPSARDKDHYVTPAITKEPRKIEHKKVYSVDDGMATLVADVDISTGERAHRRRDSVEQGFRMSAGAVDRERDRGRRGTWYHINGAQHKPPREKNINDEDAYSYTDAAGMYRDTEPRWRETRPRRGSLDRGGASRERSVSLLEPSFGVDPRASFREIGPPPSTRGWDKIKDGLGRTRSVRDGPRTVAQSPTRGRHSDCFDGSGYPPPRNKSSDRRTALHHDRPNDSRYDQHDEYERREPRRERRSSMSREPRPERRRSVSRAGDPSVERRGFGIRLESNDRYGRGSDESFNERKYRDSGFVEPNRRDTAPDMSYHEEKRSDAEKKDRSVPNDDRDKRDRDSRRKEDSRGYEREYERERHHQRRDTDRDYNRKDRDDRDSGDSGQSGLSKGATGGLAGAAAAIGLGKLFGKDKNNDNREKDRDRERDRHDESRADRRTRPPDSHNEDKPPFFERVPESDRYRERDSDRGLGFAFESAPPQKNSVPPPTDIRERESEREHEDKQVKMPSIPPSQDTVDADEDYRRRMEQVQRELGQQSIQQISDSDPDRERRRREREQRMRERESRAPVDSTNAASLSSATSTANSSVPQQRSFENESDISSMAPGLKRRPSILDQPINLSDAPAAQIIDNSLSEKRENRVRIVDPPAAEDEDGKKPKGILKKPTEKFPEDKNVIREGVAPLKDATKKGIPPGARWTKIDRRLVNPEALDEAKERFEERLDCVIVLRVLTKEEIQTLADRTREIRDERYEEDRAERKEARRRERKNAYRDDDEYSQDDSEFEFSEHRPPPKMLEAPPSMAPPSLTSSSDRDRSRRKDHERDPSDREYQDPRRMSGGLGIRD
ncbi:Hypothetical protein R9X50_00797700 [Acrodontium crateriforme]|uniref:DUF8035 domain-containing protein n=1 Tax=Acrodontium crateriforme TaxID=150365 RepID=A0AAQ3MCV9_9PEZI|nr:Hypothetical protein R9X50_00797700 [Acrodontium crateriforme]